MLPIATTLPAAPLEPPVEHVIPSAPVFTISDDESNENEAASAEDLRQSALATCGTSQGGYVSGGTEIDSGSEAEPPEFQLTEAPALQHTEAPDLQQCAETLIDPESPELHNAVAPGWEHTVHTHTHQSSGSGRFRCSPHEKLRNLVDRAVREGASKADLKRIKDSSSDKLRNLINRACEEGISKADSEQIDSEIGKLMFLKKRARYESQSASSGSHQTYRPPSPQKTASVPAEVPVPLEQLLMPPSPNTSARVPDTLEQMLIDADNEENNNPPMQRRQQDYLWIINPGRRNVRRG